MTMIAEIYYYFRFFKTNVRRVEILLSVSIFTFASSSACHSASARQIDPRHSFDVISIFLKMVATASQFSFQHRFLWVRSFTWLNLATMTVMPSRAGSPSVRSFGKVQPKSTCRPNFGELSESMAEIHYFGFLKKNVRHVEILLPVSIFNLRHHRHVILHLPTKFRPNRTIRGGVITSKRFSRWRPSAKLNFLKDNWRPPTK